jgi:hypothetical protein
MHAALLGLWLCSAGDAPTVAVDIDALRLTHAQSEQLHGELITRLVESGHAVGSTGVVTVRLTGGGTRVHVEVQHGGTVRARDVEGRGALLRLAAIHAAIDLLAGLAVVIDPDPALASAPERSLVIEADPAAAAWMPSVITALVDSGNVVKPSAAGAGLRVCLGARDALPTIAVVAVDAPCPAGASSEDLRRDLGDAVAQARLAAASPPTQLEGDAEPDDALPDDAPVATLQRTSAPRRARSRWSGALGFAAGPQVRPLEGEGANAEAVVLVHGDARHDSGAIITTRIELMPAVEDRLTVVDTVIAMGGGYGFRPRPRLRIELLAAAGVLVHGYAFDARSGGRAAFTAELPLTLGIVLAPRIELGITVVGGYSTREPRHLDGAEVLWNRGRWRVAGLVGLRFVLGRKLAAAKTAGGA